MGTKYIFNVIFQTRTTDDNVEDPEPSGPTPDIVPAPVAVPPLQTQQSFDRPVETSVLCLEKPQPTPRMDNISKKPHISKTQMNGK